MGRVIGKKPCPQCRKIGKDRSGDNLAVYDTGSVYCFSCGYYHQGNGPRRRLNRSTSDPLAQVDVYPLPSDVEPVIPAIALEWLKLYHISMTDIVNNHLLWSPSKEYLIFPYDNAWQGRYFGGNPEHPKWFSQGKLDEITHGFNLSKKCEKGVIVVEDIVSAIRVGNSGASCVPLFGSTLTNTKLAGLMWITDSLTFWLDYDKRESAMAQALRMQQFGMNADIIVTKEDPKCFTDEGINEVLASHEYI